MIDFDNLFHGQGRLIHVEFHVCMYNAQTVRVQTEVLRYSIKSGAVVSNVKL